MQFIDRIPPSWRAALTPVLRGPTGAALEALAAADADEGIAILPPPDQRLAAFALTPLDRVKVVILGQDPYHGAGQAHGLAFSVGGATAIPPSLRNIYKELDADCSIAPAATGDLTRWAEQGVLLLNSALSVAEGQAGSHRGRGWEALTDAALAAVAALPDPSVFVLWGSDAQTRAARIPGIADGRHLVIRSAHPSPLSAYRGFFGSRPFSRANAFLTAHERRPVDWRVG